VGESLTPRAEHRVENYFLGFPDQRHCHRQRQQDEKDKQQAARAVHPDKQPARGHQRIRQLQQHDDRDDEKQQPDQQPAVERGELARLVAQRLVRQHRGEALEDEVQVEQKQHTGEFQQPDGVGEEILFRQLVVPVDERTQAKQHQREQLRAVERVPPRTFLLLKIRHLPQAIDEQRVDGERGQKSERLEPVGARGLGADEQRGGQSPKKRGQSAREFAERAEQLRIGRSHRGKL